MTPAFVEIVTAIRTRMPWHRVRRTLTGQGSRASRRWVLAVGWGLATMAVIAAVRPPTTPSPPADPISQTHGLLAIDSSVVLVPVRLADQFAATWLRVGDHIDLYTTTASVSSLGVSPEPTAAGPLAVDARITTFLTSSSSSGLFSASGTGAGSAVVVAVRSDRASVLARAAGRPLGVVLRR
ncbi:MAG TPA: hypothetical protein DHW34_07205 [Actinobacteria bacterium]|nr:hypothetical protein [Actinomycetota bacterium]HCK79784.1 hypothetical protein [Actinomycetota bacterium]